jgi:hypothetical protein
MPLKYSRFNLQIWTTGVPLARNKQTFADLGPKFAYCGLKTLQVFHFQFEEHAPAGAPTSSAVHLPH